MRIKLVILLCVVSFNLTAQSDEQVKTIFGNEKPHVGYFFCPSFQLGNIAGSTAVMPGIGAGVIFNNKISLDLKYKFTITENTPAGESDQLYLHGQWIGLRCEYTILPERVVHLSFPLEVGLGEVELDVKDSFENLHVTVPAEDGWFANIEPGVALEINIWKYTKLNFTAGYRFVSDFTFRSLTEKDIRGITYSAGLKIGLF